MRCRRQIFSHAASDSGDPTGGATFRFLLRVPKIQISRKGLAGVEGNLFWGVAYSALARLLIRPCHVFYRGRQLSSGFMLTPLSKLLLDDPQRSVG
jgi:hypothetical protein